MYTPTERALSKGGNRARAAAVAADCALTWATSRTLRRAATSLRVLFFKVRRDITVG